MPRLLSLAPWLALAAGAPVAAQPLIEAKQGMVTSARRLASEAGLQILEKGGNAVDAAAATGLALAVTYPVAGNLGGGGFMLIHLASGREVVVDYRETAPAAATRDMYLGPAGVPIHGPGSPTLGWMASGVPGTVAGLSLAVETYGSHKVTWAEICEPARRLAAAGTPMTRETAESLRTHESLLSPFEESAKVYLKGGAALEPGTIWVQADLGKTLGRIASEGRRDFYEGETARRIAAAMDSHGGTITLADLRSYRPVVREPLHGTYRGFDIVTVPPPSSGGVALLQMLGMLEPREVGLLPADSAEKHHLFAEVMKRAFRDRSEYLGDADFVKVPVQRLLDRAYLSRRMADFDPARSTPAASLGAGLGSLPPKQAHESNETTHFSVVDAEGNAVSNTYTLNGAYGSGVTIPGTGILMNNEMDDFTTAVGIPNAYGLVQGAANSIEPGKRPLSSMTPTFVLRDGGLVLVTGSPGGPTIINTVLEIVTNVIDYHMSAPQAVAAPRTSEQWMPDLLYHEEGAFPRSTEARLAAMGHVLATTGRQGDGESIGVGPDHRVLTGAPDPRNTGAASAGR